MTSEKTNAIGMANMYSGIANPERELSVEELDKVVGLMNELVEPYIGPTHSPMGFTGYSVFNHKDGWFIAAHFTGWCSVHSGDKSQSFKDTSGMTAYLQLILGPMVQKHYEEAAVAFDDPPFFQSGQLPDSKPVSPFSWHRRK